MPPRIAYNKYSPNALHAMFALEKHLKSSSIEEKLLHLTSSALRTSTAALTALTCIPKMPAPRATPRCVSTPSTPGVKRRSSLHANAPPSPGPNRSRSFPKTSTGRNLRRHSERVQRTRTSRPHLRHRHQQRMEPPSHCHACRPGRIPTSRTQSRCLVSRFS
jgi:hypothetical protein